MSTVPCLALFALYAQCMFVCVNVYKMMVVVMMMSVCSVSLMEMWLCMRWGHLFFLCPVFSACSLVNTHSSIWTPCLFPHSLIIAVRHCIFLLLLFCLCLSFEVTNEFFLAVWNLNSVRLFLEIIVLIWILLSSTEWEGSKPVNGIPSSSFMPRGGDWVRSMCI